MSNNRQQLACLYTKHKTQKRKVWQDGRLVLKANSSKAILHDANPPPGSGDPSLGECEITTSQLQAILQQFSGQSSGINICFGTNGLLETERYLIEIEGPWTSNSNTSFSASSASHTVTKRQLNGKKDVSSSMKKLLASKFQKPKSYVPPPPGSQRSKMEQRLGKRRRPLQPGELVARHYGGGTDNFGGNRNDFNNPQTNFSSQHDQDYRGGNYNPQQVRGNMNENNGSGPPLAHPNAQRNACEESTRSFENPVEGTNNSFPSAKNRNSGVPASGAGISRGAGPAATGSQVRSLQQHNQYGRANSQRRTNTLSFVQNEFDSARYYGTDEEDEGGEEDQSSPNKPPFAQGLIDTRNGEQQQGGKNSQIQNKEKRTNTKTGKGHLGDSLQRVDNTHEYQAIQAPNPAGPTNCHHNQCLPSAASSAPLSNPNENENIREASNDNKKQNQSSSKFFVAQRKSHQLQSHKELNYDDEESEEDDEDFSDYDTGAPIPFQLKSTSTL